MPNLLKKLMEMGTSQGNAMSDSNKAHFQNNLITQAEELSDSLPIIRDRVEEIITSENIDYIDDLIDRTYYLEDILKKTVEVLSDRSQPFEYDSLVTVSYDLDLIGNFVDSLDNTSLFLTKDLEKKKKT